MVNLIQGCSSQRYLSEIYTTWGYSKLLQHTEVLYSIQKKKKFIPIQVQICPTELCESDCPFCAVANRPLKSSMSWEMIERCLNDFKSLGAKSVEITGGGNPLLYRRDGKDVNNIIKLAAELGFDIGIITNSHDIRVIKSELYDSINWLRVSLIKLDEGKVPEDYKFYDFPIEKLGFSYIVYDEGQGCRTKKDYEGTSFATFEKIDRLVKMYPQAKFVRIAGNALITGYNQETKEKYQKFVEKYPKFFIKDIGYNDFPYDFGCYIGMIRPFVAPSPEGDGKYYAYVCNSHVLFSYRTYNLDYALCEVSDIIEAYGRANMTFEKAGYPYQVRDNGGKNWKKTCKLCFYQPNNELLHSVVTEIPDKNFP